MQIQQPRLPSIHTKIVPRNMSAEVIFKRSIHKQKTMREPAGKWERDVKADSQRLHKLELSEREYKLPYFIKCKMPSI